MKNLIIAAMAFLISSCGKEITTQTIDNAHDGNYSLTLYLTAGDCIQDGDVIQVRVDNGVIVHSSWSGKAISGMVTGNSLEAFIDVGQDLTVDIRGEFKSVLAGHWELTGGACKGYFEETSR